MKHRCRLERRRDFAARTKFGDACQLLCTIGVVLSSGLGARKSLRQDSRAPGPLLNTKSIVLGSRRHASERRESV